jgi:uncharacterized protein YndB with AHSA1/START domain
MNLSSNSPVSREIVYEEVLPHAREVVWRTLTDSTLIGQWLMPNDFQATVGRQFTFRTKPVGSWDGVVHCEVIEVEPYARLVYSWKGGTDDNATYGSRLDSLVTWTLTPVEGGTRLRLVHSGFRSPQNDFAFEAMNGGWAKVLLRISAVASGIRADV